MTRSNIYDRLAAVKFRSLRYFLPERVVHSHLPYGAFHDASSLVPDPSPRVSDSAMPPFRLRFRSPHPDTVAHNGGKRGESSYRE